MRVSRTPMPLRIAAPTDALYTPLLAAGAAAAGVQLLRLAEEECARLMRANRAELALLSPLAYGQLAGEADYRIVPTAALALEGYTERVWLYFRPNIRTIAHCAVPSLASFLTHALQLLLKEVYDLEPTFTVAAGRSILEALCHADAVLSWEEDIPGMARLDVAEEWYVAFEHMLPIAFWVCRPEELPAELPDVVNRLVQPGLPPHEAITEDSSTLPARHGTIHWRWSEAVADAVEKTLQLLFYHGRVPHLVEVRLWENTSPL